jgi:hypothetical protein
MGPRLPFQNGRHKKKAPTIRPGLKSLNAVITIRHLLREEKQGMTASRLSFANYFSR